MAEADWDTVYLRKSKPKSSTLKSQQAVNAAQRQGLQVDTQKKSMKGDASDADVSAVPTLSAAAPAGQQETLSKVNVPKWKRKLRALHVTNLPVDTTSTLLEPYFSRYGLVLDLWVDNTREKKQGYTFAFVRYDNMESAENAIAHMNNFILNGHHISVTFCTILQNRLDRLDSMRIEQISKETKNMEAIKEDIEKQCVFYNCQYIHCRREANFGAGLHEVDPHEIIKGMALYTYNVPDRAFSRVVAPYRLDLQRFDRLLELELPHRQRFTLAGPAPASTMSGVGGATTIVLVPGRGAGIYRSSTSAQRPPTGRGAYLHNLLNRSRLQ